MTAILAGSPIPADLRLSENIGWWDPDAQCTVMLSQPLTDPELWTEYLRGAQLSYAKHGVERAFDVEAVRTGGDTVLFWALVDASGRVVGGVRAKGPLASDNESHAIVEWAGHRGLRAVRKMIADRVPFGVLEMKSAWVIDDPDRNRSLTKVLARSGFHAMPLLGHQFCMATAAAFVLERWRSSGGVVASAIPAAPYPDERYLTKMMWWDRRTFAVHAEPDQVAKILREMNTVAQRCNGLAGMGTQRASAP